MLERDIERFSGCLARTDVMPLGSGAVAGVAYDIDREFLARELNFSRISQNSMDAVSDRDSILEYEAAASICMMHLSRLAEEIILWSSTEFSFIELDEAYTTGSSIMPQKKNPDVPELVRGKTGRINGHLVSLLTLMKGQPLAYNKDNQEDKEPLFDTIDNLRGSLKVFADMVPAISVNRESMREAAIRGFSTATDLADYLVRKGVPFRDAHEIVGKSVRYGIESGKDLGEMKLAELQQFSDTIQQDVFAVLTLEGSVSARNHLGGTAPDQVRGAVARGREWLS